MEGVSPSMPAASIAPDTNVLLRFLVLDDDAQTAEAVRLIDQASSVFVSNTVMLETEWVLRSAFGLKPADVRQCLLAVCGLPHVQMEQPEAIAQALTDFAAGMDFADALHLAAAQAAGAALHTFDARCARLARKQGRAVVLAKPRKH